MKFPLCALALTFALMVPAQAVPTRDAPTRAAIPVQAGERAAVVALFQRAMRAYGHADAVSMNYATNIVMGDDSLTSRGVLIFEAPAHFRYEYEIMGDKTLFVYDGYTLMMQSAGEKPRRVVVAPNQTVWDALPDVSLPDPLIDSFLAGQNALDDLGDVAMLSKLPAQTIGGVPCDGALVKADAGDETLQISAYFNRVTGLLQRVITQTGETTLTTNYSSIELDPVIAPGTFSLALTGAKATAHAR